MVGLRTLRPHRALADFVRSGLVAPPRPAARRAVVVVGASSSRANPVGAGGCLNYATFGRVPLRLALAEMVLVGAVDRHDPAKLGP